MKEYNYHRAFSYMERAKLLRCLNVKIGIITILLSKSEQVLLAVSAQVPLAKDLVTLSLGRRKVQSGGFHSILNVG